MINTEMNNFNYLDHEKFTNLVSELNSMLSDSKIVWKHNQICLNSNSSDSNNYHLGVGSLTKDWESRTKIESINDQIIVPNKANPLRESDFTTLCDVFKGTEFEKLYTYLLDLGYRLGRVRIMKLDPKTCLSWHTDTSKRLHYVLTTGIGAFLIVENEIKHLEQDSWYMVDTRKFHTAMNSSLKQRIHIVATIL